jgi:hypothetical protein
LSLPSAAIYQIVRSGFFLTNAQAMAKLPACVRKRDGVSSLTTLHAGFRRWQFAEGQGRLCARSVHCFVGGCKFKPNIV